MSFASSSTIELFADQVSVCRPGSPELVRGLCERACELTSMARLLLLAVDELGNLAVVQTVGFDTPLPDGTAASTQPVPLSIELLEGAPTAFLANAWTLGLNGTLLRTLGLSWVAACAVTAGERPIGLLLMDRGDESLVLGDGEVEQLSAIAPAVGLAISLQGYVTDAVLGAQVSLARQVHDEVIQRLFGVLMVLSAEEALIDPVRRRCQAEVSRALGDLRALLDAPVDSELRPPRTLTLSEQLADAAARHPDLPLQLPDIPESPRMDPDIALMVQHFLDEALRNVRKHARPTRVAVEVVTDGHDLTIAVHNDGMLDEPVTNGLGLRLLAAETRRMGGKVRHGSPSSDCWRVALTVPVEGLERECVDE